MDSEEPDYYTANNVFWVPKEARWSTIQSQARQNTNGTTIDQAMTAIERDNSALRGILPKDYGRDALDKQRLGEVIDLVGNIKVGGADAQATDVLGRVYEYFLEQFAMAEGRKGGEFYTPRSVVQLLVAMIEPYKGRVYDPCCGSAGMFIQSVRFIEAHATGNGNGGRARNNLSIYGQESNQTTWRLARMNLAIRGIEGQVEYGDSFRNDRHPNLKADYILANPPFNVKEWQGEQLRRAGAYVLKADLVKVNIERRRRAEATEEWRKRYDIRAGIEGTNSELKHAHGLGRLRVRGGRRVRLAVYLKALACNFKRMVHARLVEMENTAQRAVGTVPAVAAA